MIRPGNNTRKSRTAKFLTISTGKGIHSDWKTAASDVMRSFVSANPPTCADFEMASPWGALVKSTCWNSAAISGGRLGGRFDGDGAADSGVPAFAQSSSQIPRELVSFVRCSKRSAPGPMGVQSSRTV